MIAHALLYGIALAGNCAIVVGMIFSPVKVDPTSVRLYKTTGPRNNELEYTILKRGPQDVQETPDSKERRSQMGSSFMRFGRTNYEGSPEKSDYGNSGNDIADSGSPLSLSGLRPSRGRSDVIIRFGRAGGKNFVGTDRRISTADVKFLRYDNGDFSRDNTAKNFEQLAVVCSNVLSSTDSNGNEARLYLTKLARLCNTLGLGNDDDAEIRRKSKIIEFLEDASQPETVKSE